MWHDLKLTVRGLLGRPGFTLAAGLTLALAIGACVAIFSVVDGVLLRPLPYPQSERLVALDEINPPQFMGGFVRPWTYDEWRAQAKSFEGLAAVRIRSYNVTGAGAPLLVRGAHVTANTLGLLRVRPAVGRDFLPEEDQVGRGNAVILDHGFWVRQLGGRAVLGTTLVLDGQACAVVGVLPAGVELEGHPDLLVPGAYVESADWRRSVGRRSLLAFGRLGPGATLAEARREMDVISARMASEDSAMKGWRVRLTPMLESRVGETRVVLLAVLGAVALLLLLACANVGNLMLARATARAKEMAVRVALGATAARLLRQALVENLVLSGVASAVGVLLAYLALAALVPADLPRGGEVALNGRALALACGLSLTTGVLFGLASTQIRNIRGGGYRLREALVVAQVALALVLLVAAGLLGRSFSALLGVERGFRPEGAYTFTVDLPADRYGVEQDPRLAAFPGRAADAVAALPGVQAAGAVQALPFSVEMNLGTVEVVGRPQAAPQVMYVFQCTPGYFEAMGIRLLRGRFFDARDAEKAPRVAVVNEALVRRFFRGEDPIGKRLSPPGRPEVGGTIVGVVADVRDGRVARYEGDVPNQVYAPLTQNPYDVLTFVVRQAGPPAAVASAIAAIDGQLPTGPIRPLSDWVADSIGRQRLAASLFAVFGVAALLLAALGVYSVMAFAVARRTRDLGIRIALGARSDQVFALVLRQGLGLAALGVAVGLGGALATSRLLSSELFGIAPHDPITLSALVILLALVSLVACAVPARRACAVDPVVALKAE